MTDSRFPAFPGKSDSENRQSADGNFGPSAHGVGEVDISACMSWLGGLCAQAVAVFPVRAARYGRFCRERELIYPGSGCPAGAYPGIPGGRPADPGFVTGFRRLVFRAYRGCAARIPLALLLRARQGVPGEG